MQIVVCAVRSLTITDHGLPSVQKQALYICAGCVCVFQCGPFNNAVHVELLGLCPWFNVYGSVPRGDLMELTRLGATLKSQPPPIWVTKPV